MPVRYANKILFLFTNIRLETASEIARKYCLIKDGVFMLPSRDDLVEHRVVVTTLSTSQVLLDLQVFHGFFTHILIDEAAQALEPEALTPLIFAGPNTKVVFTGDHMQVLQYTFKLNFPPVTCIDHPVHQRRHDCICYHALFGINMMSAESLATLVTVKSPYVG